MRAMKRAKALGVAALAISAATNAEAGEQQLAMEARLRGRPSQRTR
jgi:hypothetical protein